MPRSQWCKPMLNYSLRTNSVPRPRLDNGAPFDGRVPAGTRTAASRFIDQYSQLNEDQTRHFGRALLTVFPARHPTAPAADIFPSTAAQPRILPRDVT